MSPALITREHNGAAFSASGAQAEGPFREDGFFNMTKAAQHFGKRLDNFWKAPETKAYVAVAARTLKSRDLELFVAVPGNRYVADRGTWAHPKLAVFFARWLSAEFSWWCDMQIDDILHGRSVVVPVQAAQPATLTMEQVNEAIRAALAPVEQRLAGLLAAPLDDVKHGLRRSGATLRQRICPAVH